MKSENNDVRSVVSDEELALLTGPLKQIQPKSVDRGFKYRMTFLLVFGVLIIIRNLFFPETVLEFTGQIKEEPAFLLLFQARAFLGAGMLSLYFYSYLKDWHFERVGYFVTGMISTVFIRDFLTHFMLSSNPLTILIIFDLVLLGCIFGCFLLNALRDNRAPSMPRTLWS